MGRKKTCTKKGKRPISSEDQQPATSRQRTSAPSPPLPSGVSRVFFNTDLSQQSFSKARRTKLEDMKFFNNRFLDWRLLREFGMEEKVRDKISVGPWATLFEINEPAYRDITIEFLSTLQFKEHSHTHKVDTTLTFQVYGQAYSFHLSKFGLFLGLYSAEEIESPAYLSMTNDWPEGARPEEFWKLACFDNPVRYLPSKSKATSMTDTTLKVVHHLLAHTIGGRSSSHGVVNSFELFHLYSMATKYPINVAVEVAYFIKRQATDPRVNGIYCGGYITRLLKGMNLFREPPKDTPCIKAERITDGPFYGYGLIRLAGGSTPGSTSQSKTPPRGTSGASIGTPLRDYEFQRLRQEFHAERKKSKKFRRAVWSFLQSLAGCLSPPPQNLPTYETSSEYDSETSPERDLDDIIVVNDIEDDEDDEDDADDDDDEDDDDAPADDDGTDV